MEEFGSQKSCFVTAILKINKNEDINDHLIIFENEIYTDFLELKKNHGDEEMRARDLFYALWTPSLFMEKVEQDLEWCLFCPDKCPGLSDCYGEEFNALYKKYEYEGKMNKLIGIVSRNPINWV